MNIAKWAITGLLFWHMTGCSAGPIVPLYGRFETSVEESFTGEVQANYWIGGAKIYGKGIRTNVVCEGHTPYSGCFTPDRIGHADLLCTDGRLIRASFYVEDCNPLQGWGSGFASNGDEFFFIFGGSQAEAEHFFQQEKKHLLPKKSDIPL